MQAIKLFLLFFGKDLVKCSIAFYQSLFDAETVN